MLDGYLKRLQKSIGLLRAGGHEWPGYPQDPVLNVGDSRADKILADLAARLGGNFPFGHPEYAGQMLKPPHPLAWTAYALAMAINPNNHALDGGPPTSDMEKECVRHLASMFGYGPEAMGHLSSSGTIANLEALWISGQLHPGKSVAFTSSAHYTHERISSVLGLKTVKIPAGINGEPDLDFLKKQAAGIGTLVVTMGTTGTGIVEPLHKVVDFCRNSGIRIHIDAAYGGFFKLIENSGLIDGAPWSLTGSADSIVIDPHKHGLQPYGCGCILFRDASPGRFYKHDSPYTYFLSEDLHLGEISLECSRAGASAAALWATLQAFPLKIDTGFGPVMKQCRQAALHFSEAVGNSECFFMVMQPELDIVIYAPVTGKSLASEISGMSQAIFRRGMEMAAGRLYLSLYRMPVSQLDPNLGIGSDSDEIILLRSVLMKPEHLGFIPELLERLEKLHESVISGNRF
jgi:glutamate/tyrosine decarboxylase-like PLP-dependent enzyme